MSNIHKDGYLTLNEFAKWLQNQVHKSVFVLCDSNTAGFCFPVLQNVITNQIQLITIPADEKGKAIESCNIIWEHLTKSYADRSSLLINLGGGMITDIGGFAAATYKRGIHFVNIPTTLLAMVDASAGGKTGINFQSYKNQIGVFANPELVVIDNIFLKTLPVRELRSAYAEIIKHFLIADRDAFQSLLKPYEESYFTHQDTIIYNISIKKKFTDADPYDMTIRKALNFGHTVGHAIESLMMGNINPLLHGEAIAMGLVAESYISYKLGKISLTELKEIEIAVCKWFKFPEIEETNIYQCIQLMKHDKKNDSGKVKFTLLQGIGNYCIDQSVEESIIAEAIKYGNTFSV